ncbi:TetR/AcrR family transcriptional regulator [Streptomyces sp. SBR177]
MVHQPGPRGAGLIAVEQIGVAREPDRSDHRRGHEPPGRGPLGRRERNKLKVKERLYSSAIALFAEQGYDETSIDEIVERADVARGTFFNYFQRKEDLLGAWGESGGTP